MDLTVPLTEVAWNRIQAGEPATLKVTAPGDVAVQVTVVPPPQTRRATEPGG